MRNVTTSPKSKPRGLGPKLRRLHRGLAWVIAGWALFAGDATARNPVSTDVSHQAADLEKRMALVRERLLGDRQDDLTFKANAGSARIAQWFNWANAWPNWGKWGNWGNSWRNF